jgi:hypothetical protein
VLQGEQRLEHGQPKPEARDHGRVVLRVGRQRHLPIWADPQLAVLAAAREPLLLRRRAVDLGAVPPGRLGVGVGGRQVAGPGRAGRVGSGPHDQHWRLGPGVVVGQWDLPGVVGGAAPVTEPVADHPLEPRRHQRVDRRGGHELVPGEQGQADLARAGPERVGVGEGVLDGHVAAEARAGHAHGRLLQVVVGAVDGAPAAVAGVRRPDRRRVDGRLARGVVQVLLPQGVAQPDQHGQAERGRQLVPADLAVDHLGRAVVQPPGQRLAVAAGGRRTPAFTRPPDQGADGHPGPERHGGRGHAGQALVPPAPGRDRQPGVHRRDQGREDGGPGGQVALGAGGGRGHGVAGMDHDALAQGAVQRLVTQDEQLGPDHDGADAEQAQGVDDATVDRRVGAEALGQQLGREQGHAAVDEPDRGERVAGAGTQDHGDLLDWSLSGSVASPARKRSALSPGRKK